MTRYLLILVLFSISCVCNAEKTAPELGVNHDEPREEHADWLGKNFNETDFTGHIKIKSVSVHEQLSSYVVLLFQAEVLEVFKGEHRREITYLHMMEGPITRDLNLWVGSTPIVSLYRNKKSGAFEMGDNGYDLPDTPDLLSIARGLAKKKAAKALKRERP